MRSGIVAVWDQDREYAENLSEYLRRQGGLGSSVVLFSDLQHLQRAVETRQVAVTLAGSQAEESSWLKDTPVLFLTDEIKPVKHDSKEYDLDVKDRRTSGTNAATNPVANTGAEAVTDVVSAVRKADSARRYAYKYQPAREILRIVSHVQERAAAERVAVAGVQLSGQPARIRGIYSPIGGCLKTSLGLVMGCLLAEEKRCLFVSLEAHSGFRTLFGRQYPVDLADLFALVRQGGNLQRAITESLQPFGKLRYIPPVIWPVDIREAEFSEMKELLQRLALCGQFDEIIVDVGTELARPEKVLAWCDRIYQPEKEDIFSRAKLAEYGCYLKVSGYEGLTERTCRIPLSQLGVSAETAALDQWQRWEQMIPAVRRILEEESHGESM